MDNATIDLQHQFYDMLMQSQYWSPERMRDYQRSQLTHLLRHAKKNVPFYENRLDAVLKSNGDIDWDRWGEIPIVKRSDLIEHREAMQARELPPGHGALKVFSTSGSTGAPVSTTHNSLAAIASKAVSLRSYGWHNVDWTKDLCMWIGDNPSSNWPHGSREGSWGPLWEPKARNGHTTYLNRATTTANVLEFLERTKQSYIGSRPKNVQVLSQYLIQNGGRLKLNAALTFGTGITAEERADCLEAFGCEMLGQYSSKEAYQIGYQCSAASHYHHNAEIVLLEVVDDAGLNCSPGQAGRVLVTPLFSTAQPLIRYEQGDLAVLGVKCTCGRHLPVISRVLGRITHLFRFPDGTKVAPSIPAKYQILLGAEYWQVAQVAPTHVTIRYVPISWDTYGDQAAVATAVRSHIHPDITVSFERVREFPKVYGDKYIEYVNELT